MNHFILFFGSLLHLWVAFSNAQSACDDPEESGYNDVVASIPDSSGVQALSGLPVPIGSQIIFQCPGVKTYKVRQYIIDKKHPRYVSYILF